MSFKNKKTASYAGRKAGIRRSEKALGKILKNADAGEKVTMTISKRFARMMNDTYGMDYEENWLFNKYSN